MDGLQNDGWMPADRTLSGIGGLSLAIELNERAHQDGLLFRGVTKVTLNEVFVSAVT
jgi:hypothetical protein